MSIDKKLSESSKINALFQQHGIGFRETNKFRRNLKRMGKYRNWLRQTIHCLKIGVLP